MRVEHSCGCYVDLDRGEVGSCPEHTQTLHDLMRPAAGLYVRRLSERDSLRVADALERPPAPNARLRRAARR